MLSRNESTMSIIFLNTRPEGRNHSIFYKHTTIKEYSIPLLALYAQPLTAELQQQLKNLVNVDVIIVVSPAAAEILDKYLHQLHHFENFQDINIIKRKSWVAVGRKTAEYLRKMGIFADIPQIETSEGMWQLDVFKKDIRRVAFLRGFGGREWLMNQFSANAVQVDNILLYRRECPQNLLENWRNILHDLQKSLVKNEKYQIFVLISSGASWQYWQQCLQYQLPQGEVEWTYLVLGERVCCQVQKDLQKLQKIAHAKQLNRLHYDEILEKMGLV